MIGQILGQYRILERLGEGGMGVVYKALDTHLNRQVAIKVLPPEVTADAERRLRFQREAQTAAALDHPSIATIYQVGEHEQSQYIAMQLLEGQTLRQRIAQGALPLREWLRVARAIAEALSHAHARRIVHRDLKPDNVMLTVDDQIKVLDFGLAKLMEPKTRRKKDSDTTPSRLETITRDLGRGGKVFGTVAYMSPEQARGEPADHRSDLFSYGIMLYQMATGRLPFKESSDVETLHAIIANEPPPVSEIATGFPPEAERVVRKALEKEPDRRYQNAADLVADLRNLQRDIDSGSVSTTSGPPGIGAVGRGAAPAAGRARRWMIGAAAAAVAIVVLSGVLALRRSDSATDSSPGPGTAGGQARRAKIVVLPFENLGPPEDAYFADGITEEITSRLAAENDLGVISRKSAIQYASLQKTTREVGEELGVDYVLEGTVRWARDSGGSNRVRITPQLIRVSDDTHIWAEVYDRIVDDIFEVQSEIAWKVIDRLGMTLGGTERKVVDHKRTGNFEAYRAYLRGIQYAKRPGISRGDLDLAVQMFQRAVDLDPEFCGAYAELTKSHSQVIHAGFDTSAERHAQAKQAAERALELAPDSPEVHLAVGYYHYWGHKDYEKALEEFAIAAEGLPNNSDLHEAMAYVWRRQGRWDEAVASLLEAEQLSPLDPRVALELGNTYKALRRYEEALRSYQRSIALAPDQLGAYSNKAETYILWKGSPADSRRALEEVPHRDHPDLLFPWFWQEVVEGDYQRALERLASAPPRALEKGKFQALLAKGFVYKLLNEPQHARQEFESARKELEAVLEERPGDYRIRAALGLALASLDRREEAIHEAERAIELYPVSKDALDGPDLVLHLAGVYMILGELDPALDRIEYLLSIPAGVSIPSLKTDPRWQSLKDHPRFKALAKRFS